MLLSDLESEDIALLLAVSVATTAALVEEFYSSPSFKALKIFALFLSLGLAVHRIRTSKPYRKDVTNENWEQVKDSVRVRIPRSEHKRGKSPSALCFVRGEDGGYTECMTENEINEKGDVTIRVNTPTSLRIEVRK